MSQKLLMELDKLSEKGWYTFFDNDNRVNEATLKIPLDKLITTANLCKNKLNYQFLIDICGVDWLNKKKPRFEVVYHLFNFIDNQRLRLIVNVDEEVLVPSLTSLWKGADWLERETFDMYGIRFADHPDLRRILTHEDFVGYPLRKDYPATKNQVLHSQPLEHIYEKDRQRLSQQMGEDLMWINIGPAHPATHGTLRFMAVIDGGETIKKCDTEIGYLHRCFEKMCENHNYNQIIPYTDRLNYCSSPLNNNAFALVVEKLLGVTVPPRAMVIRMILDELSRIIDHFVCIGTNAVDLGAITGFFYFFADRERVYTLFEKLCGARLTVSLTRIGGVGFDLPSGWIDELKEVITSIEKTMIEVEKLLTDNRIFKQRTIGTGVVDRFTAIEYGFTGPVLRAAGVDLDLRKKAPYYYYNDCDFDIPIGAHGDTYDRYLVRMEEIYQSIKILKWCIKNLPDGKIMSDERDISLPDKKDVYGNIEGLMNQFMLIIHGVKTPVGAVYHAVEAANGELGFYIVSDGQGTPYRVKCRAPCFALMSGFAEVVTGTRIADAISALGSFNIVAGELDR